MTSTGARRTRPTLKARCARDHTPLGQSSLLDQGERGFECPAFLEIEVERRLGNRVEDLADQRDGLAMDHVVAELGPQLPDRVERRLADAALTAGAQFQAGSVERDCVSVGGHADVDLDHVGAGLDRSPCRRHRVGRRLRGEAHVPDELGMR